MSRFWIGILFGTYSWGHWGPGVYTAPEENPSYIYLSWSKIDTAHTMTVHHYGVDAGHTAPVVELSDGVEYRGFSHKIAHLNRRVSVVELFSLRPDTRYSFELKFKDGRSFGPFQFKTLPSGYEPIHFVTGGDMGTSDVAVSLLKASAKLSPMFALVGGDISYANGKLKNFGTWDLWLKNWTENMVTPEGYLIPIVAAIGNHEIGEKSPFETNPYKKAPFYFPIFYQSSETESYFVRELGRENILYVLDSGHYRSHHSQKSWLAKKMKKYWSRLNQLAVYHVPMYPSVRSEWDGFWARVFWLPTFDHYGLDVAFENHDHAFKITKRLKGNRSSRRGTLFIGDGNWGKGGRKPDRSRWYLKESGPQAHFWSVKLWLGSYTMKAVDTAGKVFAEANEETF